MYFTWRVSDCEELVGGYSQEMMGQRSDCLWGGRNCRETFGKNEVQAIYIAQTLEQISVDAARGTGPHLEVLSQLMSCPPEQAGLFSREVQGHYPLIFT